MTRRSLASPAALLVAPTALLAACSRTSTSEPDTAVTRPAASPPAESALVRSRRVTAIACSPLLRQDALAHGTGAFCAPFDSIPAVRHPRFLTAREGELPTAEPVVALELAGAARAYPVRYLVYHEVVNDVVDEPVVVTFCPLCNSAAAHSRRLGSRTLTFGVSGQLEYANLVMFDRQTLSRWQQITGQATGGSLEGRRLAPLPVQLVSFEEWRAEHPSGLVLRPPAPERYRYGLDPYANYDRDPTEPSPLFRSSADPEGQTLDPRLPPKWRVVGVATRDGAVAFAAPARGRRPVVETARLGSLRSSASSASGRRRQSGASCSRAHRRAGRRRSGRRGSTAGGSISGRRRAASSRRERAPSSTSSAAGAQARSPGESSRRSRR